MSTDKYLFSTRAFSFKELQEIAGIYGKSDLTAPEGYEFTGEFRKVKGGESALMEGRWVWQAPSAINESFGKRLILIRKIEDKPAAKPLTAAEVTEKFGPSVLNMFGYGKGLIDFPGFAYTGRIESVIAGEWYVDGAQRIQKLHSPQVSIGSYLTLVPTTPPLPRIVTYTLTEASEFVYEFPQEACYMPREDGSMEPVDPEVVPSQYYYLREEQA